MLSAVARTVHGLGQDGSQPGAEAGFYEPKPDGPRVRRGGAVRQPHLNLALERDPIREERSKGLSLDRQATGDASRRSRAEER